MTETLKMIVTKFTDEAMTITSMVLLFVLAVLIIYWLYNRRKFRQLTHQIPASVVKNYLDSIIQNSSSLKSSLFRGGDLDVGGGIPSVMPLKDLPAGSISVGASGDSEALNQKVAEVNALKGKMADKDRVINELEKRIENMSENADEDLAEQVSIYKKEVETLQESLRLKEDEITAARNAASGDGDSAELEGRLATLSQECDEMRERLAEYEIIEEDLANLKRLQQENAQLRKELDELRGGAPVIAEEVQEPEEIEEVQEVAEEISSDDQDIAEFDELIGAAGVEDSDETVVEAASQEESTITEPEEIQEEVVEAQSEQKEEKNDQRSAEELLSEFEKMLG